MAVNFHFNFKTEDAIIARADGAVQSVQADLEGYDDQDGIGRPRDIMKHAVTIRCDIEKGTLDDVDVNGDGFIQLSELGYDTAASWLKESLQRQMPPRNSGKANMWEYYTAYIKERIVANTAMFDESIGVEEPKPVEKLQGTTAPDSAPVAITE